MTRQIDRKLGYDRGTKNWIDRKKLPNTSYVLGKLWNGWAKDCITLEDAEALEKILVFAKRVEKIVTDPKLGEDEAYGHILELMV